MNTTYRNVSCRNSHPRLIPHISWPYILEMCILFMYLFYLSIYRIYVFYHFIFFLWAKKIVESIINHELDFNINVHKISAVRVDLLNNRMFWGFLTWTCYTASKLFTAAIIIAKAFFLKKHLPMIVILKIFMWKWKSVLIQIKFNITNLFNTTYYLPLLSLLKPFFLKKAFTNDSNIENMWKWKSVLIQIQFNMTNLFNTTYN